MGGSLKIRVPKVQSSPVEKWNTMNIWQKRAVTSWVFWYSDFNLFKLSFLVQSECYENKCVQNQSIDAFCISAFHTKFIYLDTFPFPICAYTRLFIDWTSFIDGAANIMRLAPNEAVRTLFSFPLSFWKKETDFLFLNCHYALLKWNSITKAYKPKQTPFLFLILWNRAGLIINWVTASTYRKCRHWQQKLNKLSYKH